MKGRVGVHLDLVEVLPGLARELRFDEHVLRLGWREGDEVRL